MKLYIDPGTGSMLFAILIGLIGALNWMIKGWIVKLRFRLSGGKADESRLNKLPLVIFADHKRYWSIFAPICRELGKRGVKVKYLTASPDDPGLNSGLENVDAEFIGEGNKAFAKLNFYNAVIMFSTTPGLDVYQWKRSKGVDFYVHIPHAASDITFYRMFGIDYYDAILLSGQYQADDIRELEKIRNLPAKELELVGIPYMDEMRARLNSASTEAHEHRNVLIAPSWGKSAIFAKFGGKIIDILLKTDYHIIIRPHPQSFTSEKEMIDKLMADYPNSDRIEWNRDADNFECLKKSDILVSDFSGVVWDFALVYDKPVIYADTEFDSSPYDAWWLKPPYWTFDALPKIGVKLTGDNLEKLPELIEECINDPRYAAGRDICRQETWAHIDEGASRTADYLVNKIQELTASKEEK